MTWLLRLTASPAPYVLAAALAFTGLAKINDPAPASDFLVELISLRSLGMVRVIGFAELALAIWLVSGAGRAAASLVAASAFTGFAVVHVYAGSTGVEAPCGCAGSSTIAAAVPTAGWIGMNTSFALLGAVAVARPKPRHDPSLPDTEDAATSEPEATP